MRARGLGLWVGLLLLGRVGARDAGMVLLVSPLTLLLLLLLLLMTLVLRLAIAADKLDERGKDASKHCEWSERASNSVLLVW